MTSCFVEQHPDRPVSVSATQQTKEILKACLSHIPVPGNNAMTGSHIDGPKQYTPGIPTADRHQGLLSFQRPTLLNPREKTDNGFILKEQYR